MLEILESLDEKVFTPELKESLQAQFNEAVETKAQEIADARIEKEINDLNEKSEEYTNLLNEKSEEHIQFLDEKANEYVEMKQEEMVESLDKYLELVVEEFVSEAKDALDESIKSEKADMMLEGFEAMLIAGGIEVSKIVEAKDNSSVEHKLSEKIEKIDSLVDENITLKEENETLIKMGLISEMAEGLSIVESEKFKKLAELVEFTRDESFAEKLETIKESVKGSTVTKEVEDASKEEVTEAAPKKEIEFQHLL